MLTVACADDVLPLQMLEGLTQQETTSSVKQAASWCLAAAAASARASSRAGQTSNTGVAAFPRYLAIRYRSDRHRFADAFWWHQSLSTLLSRIGCSEGLQCHAWRSNNDHLN